MYVPNINICYALDKHVKQKEQTICMLDQKKKQKFDLGLKVQGHSGLILVWDTWTCPNTYIYQILIEVMLRTSMLHKKEQKLLPLTHSSMPQ